MVGLDPQASLARVIGIVDRLVSPGGCPWDAEQTHTSLVPHLIEEAYEVVDAIETAGDDDHLAEELGDVLLQVLLHARIGSGRGAFDIDSVAAGLGDKLVRRHPHVFATSPADATAENPADAAAVAVRWEDLKAKERAGGDLFEGIPAHLPALARATKVIARVRRAGLHLSEVTPSVTSTGDGDEYDMSTADVIARRLFDVVADAQAEGVDAEAALRRVLRVVEAQTRISVSDDEDAAG